MFRRLCMVLFLLLTGCATPPVATPTPGENGVRFLPPDAILADARQALLHVHSVHLLGRFKVAGENVAIDVRATADGRAQGTVITDGTVVEGLLVAGTLYVRGAGVTKVLRGLQPALPPAIFDCLGEQWVIPPPAAGFATIAPFFDLSLFAQRLLQPAEGVTQLSPGTTVVRGQPALRLTDGNGREVFVSATTAPLPLRIVRNLEHDVGSVDLVDYGAVVSIIPPSAALDLTVIPPVCTPIPVTVPANPTLFP